MIKIYQEGDAHLKVLRNKTVAILGYGNQGRAQALNLKDNKIKVIIGLPSRSKDTIQAKKDGFQIFSTAQAVRASDLISILIADHLQQQVFEKEIKKNLSAGKALIFAAGFSIHFRLVNPPEFVDVILVAPHGPGTLMRELFLKNKGVPAFLAVAQDYSGNSKKIGLAYAAGIGCTKSFVMETSFEKEALGDVFGEQAVLCGGLSELIKAGFETLVKNGLPAENAYLECLYQLDLMVELIKKYGISGMYDKISLLAGFGSYLNGRRVINRKEMEKIFQEIRNGRFTSQLLKEAKSNFKNYLLFKKQNRKLAIDKTALKLKRLLKK